MRPAPTSLCLALLSLLTTLNAFAGGDLEPPDYRYAPLSTVSGWDFITDQPANAVLPDLHSLPVFSGKAPLPIQALPEGATNTPHGILFGDLEWTSSLGGSYLTDAAIGIHGITFLVPSWPDVLAPEAKIRYQKLRIQITHKGAEPRISVAHLPGIPGAVEAATRLERKRADVPLAPHDSSFFYEDWASTPASWHIVVITFATDTWLQDLVIDTGSKTEDPGSIFEDGYEDGEH